MFDTGQLSCQFPVNLKKEGATFLVGGIQESQDGNFYRLVIIYHMVTAFDIACNKQALNEN